MAKLKKIKQLSESKILKNIQDFIKKNKYLNDSKYFKNNYWSVAHFDSWAAKGQAGGCSCCNENYYQYTLHNKRASTKKGGRNSYCKDVSNNLCFECYKRIEENINFKFQNNYCR